MKRNESYVSAAEPTAPAPATRPAPTPDSVSAQWRDNLGMGIGVFCVLVSGFFIAQIVGGKFGLWRNFWTDIDATPTWIAFSFLAGVQAYGWLMAWRSSIDEIERQNTINILRSNEQAMLADIKDMENEIANLETKLAYAQRDLRERIVLQQQYQAKAQRTYTPSAQVAENEIPFAVYDKARQLVERACRNLPASKDKVCAILGWTQAEWREAHQLAQDAGLFRVVGRQTELLVDDLETALAIMDVYAGFSPVEPTS